MKQEQKLSGQLLAILSGPASITPEEASAIREAATRLDADVVNLGTGCDAHVFLIKACCAAAEPSDMFEVFGIATNGAPNVSVELLVNGVQVPFVDTVHAALRRVTDKQDAHTLKKALELVSEAGLSQVLELLRDAEVKIEDALEAALPRLKR